VEGRVSYDVLVVGAGYAGSIMAERLASQRGLRVLVVDRRPHIAGNAHDYVDEHGVLVHAYGPHIFHTKSQLVVDYLSRFTEWRPYEHRVMSDVDGKRVPVLTNFDEFVSQTATELKFGPTYEATASLLPGEQLLQPDPSVNVKGDIQASAVDLSIEAVGPINPATAEGRTAKVSQSKRSTKAAATVTKQPVLVPAPVVGPKAMPKVTKGR